MTSVHDIIEAAMAQLKAAEELVDKVGDLLDSTTREKINRRIEIADSYINLVQHMPYYVPPTPPQAQYTPTSGSNTDHRDV